MSTVKWYVRQIFNKLSASSRQEAVTRAQDLGLLPKAVSEDIVRHNLPMAATPFVGRDQALAMLDVLLVDPQVRLITVVGPGGMGKTRLAIEAARRQLNSQTSFPDGVFFVSLAPVETTEGMTTAMAAALDIQFQGPSSETEQLLNYLVNKQMLLVQDNFEHLLAGRPFLVEIGRRASGVTLLVTSRERLQLQGEQLFPLHGLENKVDGDFGKDAPATQLFLNIARRAVPDFQLLEEEVELLNRICQLVEGMPLGLELAASWVGLLPLAEIAAEIEQSLQLLAGEIHSTYYCNFLKAHENAWFTAKEPESIREIRSEVGNVQSAWRWAANNGADTLLSQGLESLCRFYDIQGQYKEGRHACHLAGKGFLRTSVWTPEQWAFKVRIFAWSSGFEDDASRQKVVIDQSQKCLEQAIKLGRDSRVEKALFHLKKGEIKVRVDLTEAIEHLNLALSLFRELNYRGGEIEVLSLLGGIYMNQGQLEVAADLMRCGLKICQQLDYMAGTAELNAKYSQIARYRGDFDESEAGLRESIQLVRRLGNLHRETIYLCTLSFTLSWAGKYVDARNSAAEAIEIDKTLNQYPDSWRLNSYVKASFHLGHYSDAEEMGLIALELANQRGHLDNAGWASMFLGSVALAQGNLVNAEANLNVSNDFLAELNHTYRDIPKAILSYVLRARGEVHLARLSLIEPLRSGIERHSVSPVMKVLPAAALLAADDSRSQRAIELYGAAQQFEHVTNSRWFADVACSELDVAAAALAKGQSLDIWETADQLLLELTA